MSLGTETIVEEYLIEAHVLWGLSSLLTAKEGGSQLFKVSEPFLSISHLELCPYDPISGGDDAGCGDG